MMRLTQPHRSVAGLLLAFAMVLSWSSRAAGDDAVDRVNQDMIKVVDSQRSELVILPVWAKMEPPPDAISPLNVTMLLPATDKRFEAAATWAQAAPQRAVLAAIDAVTKEPDFRKAMVFALPYGIEGVAGKTDLIKAGLYVDLGEAGTLAGAQFLYFRAFEQTEQLVNVEATRLAAAGSPGEAIRVLGHFIIFSRQIADRAFAKEKELAMNALIRSLERLRDIAYQDFTSSSRALKVEQLTTIMTSLVGSQSLLGADRITFPQGDRYAAEQMIGRIMTGEGKPDPEVFSNELARIGASDKPLRLFSEAAKWESLRASHTDQHDSLQLVNRVFDDWTNRWALIYNDQVHRTASDYVREVRRDGKAKALEACVDNAEAMFPLRQALRAEAAGTRIALAICIYALNEEGKIPQLLSSLRPSIIPVIDKDPYNWASREMLFFVPMRDTPKNERGEPQPYVIRLYPGGSQPNFQLSLQDNTFCVYSVGIDGNDDRLQFATQSDPEAKDGDYLFWPPALSLVRQRLIETRQLP